MKKAKFLSAIFLALITTVPCLAPKTQAMMTMAKPESAESSLSSDEVNHQKFLEEFRKLASSCRYDPYFDYEREESEIIGSRRLNSAQATKLPPRMRKNYLEKIRKASLKIVQEKHHGLCRHFCTCVVELCKKYNIKFKILVTKHQSHSAVAYSLGDKWYVADMLLQVARNHNFTVDAESTQTDAATLERDKSTMLTIAMEIIKAKKPEDHVMESLELRGVEFSRVPIGIYLNAVAEAGDLNMLCDENFTATEYIPTPPKY